MLKLLLQRLSIAVGFSQRYKAQRKKRCEVILEDALMPLTAQLQHTD
jgi:hypothetical protein